MNLNFVKALSRYSANRAEKKAERKRENLVRDAIKQAKIDYNIERIGDIDYVTNRGVPVSLPEDAKTMSLCDRLDLYRQNYVNACVAKNALIGTN